MKRKERLKRAVDEFERARFDENLSLEKSIELAVDAYIGNSKLMSEKKINKKLTREKLKVFANIAREEFLKAAERLKKGK